VGREKEPFSDAVTAVTDAACLVSKKDFDSHVEGGDDVANALVTSSTL